MDQNQPGPTPPPTGFPAGQPSQYAVPPGTQKKDNSTKIIIGVIIGVTLLFICPMCLGIGAAIMVPGFAKARQQSQLNACQENQYKIYAATQQWAMEKRIAAGQSPQWSDLVGPNGYVRSMPVCPAGGTYTLGVIGDIRQGIDDTLPSCSLPNHPYPE